MTRHRPSYAPPPRNLDAFQAACRLGVSERWFKDNLTRLRAEGFPERDKLLGGWDAAAIDLWWDRRSGIVPSDETADDGLDRRLEALTNGELAIGGP